MSSLESLHLRDTRMRKQASGSSVRRDFFERAKHASSTGAVIKKLRANIR